jgi:anti-sigma regulatory factor (Ser/Thr protein kinase)
VDTAAAHIELAATPAAPYWARRHAQAALGAWQIPPDTTETALLLISELVTNAYHATTAVSGTTRARLPGPAPITQTLRYQPGQLLIEVTDPNPNPPQPADAGQQDETGRGLLLVQALAKEWASYTPPAGRKTVYCIITIPGSPGQPHP